MTSIIQHEDAEEKIAALWNAYSMTQNTFNAMRSVYGDDRPLRNFPQLTDGYATERRQSPNGLLTVMIVRGEPYIMRIPADIKCLQGDSVIYQMTTHNLTRFERYDHPKGLRQKFGRMFNKFLADSSRQLPETISQGTPNDTPEGDKNLW